ncbi:MAG: glycosyl hydrolase 53 family protein [Actinomycetota bacterium]
MAGRRSRLWRLLGAATALSLGAALTLPVSATAEAKRGALSVRGADISFTQLAESMGLEYRDADGHVRRIETILASNGATHVRLRVWTDPPDGYSDLQSALEMAKRARRVGMKVLLDLHYSDFWADPSKQPTPAAWAGQDLATLAQTVHDYTRDTVAAFAKQGTPVDMVQVGNEVTSGMLFPFGQLYPPSGPQGWPGFTTLLKAGIAGVHDGAPRAHDPKIVIHIDRGGDNGGSVWFYDHMAAWGVDFDIIGLSYYPIWHGSLASMQFNLNDLAVRYGKDIALVETAYPFTAENGDALGNFFPSSDPASMPDLATYPATQAGQAAFFEALRAILLAVPDGHGLGFFDWEPGLLPGIPWAPGELGTPNDNLSMFDFHGNALPSLRAFRKPGGEINKP